MINVKYVSRTVSFLAFLSVLSLGLGLAIQDTALSNQSAPSGEAQNMRLVDITICRVVNPCRPSPSRMRRTEIGFMWGTPTITGRRTNT